MDKHDSAVSRTPMAQLLVTCTVVHLTTSIMNKLNFNQRKTARFKRLGIKTFYHGSIIYVKVVAAVEAAFTLQIKYVIMLSVLFSKFQVKLVLFEYSENDIR